MMPPLPSAPETGAATPLLQVRHLQVRFGTKTVVHDANFEVAAGEKLALVGESGSGKSITALALLRLAGDAQVSGQALLHERDVFALREREMQAVRGRQIAMVFQEPMTALNPLMTIGQQIGEVLQLHKGLTARQALASSIELLASVGIAEPARRVHAFAHQLSGGQRQRAMIAMAVACEPALLLADEPTTALDVTLRGQILELLSDMQRQTGMAIVLISHDLHLVRRFAHRVLVMEQGHVVEQGDVQDVMLRPKHPYTQRLIASRPVRDVHEKPRTGDALNVWPMQAQQLQVTYPTALPGIKGWFQKGQFVAVRDVSLQLYPGQTLGIVGESGSGKSTLAQALLGLLPCSGTLSIHGQAWQQPSIRNTPANQALRRQVQVVFQDPFSSLSPRMTIEEIVGEGLLGPQFNLSAAQRRSAVQQVLIEVGLSEQLFPGLLGRYPHEFSGGQRQRLAIARALIVQPNILVLDEPTSALDVTIAQQVIGLLQRLQREKDLSYVLITHDVDVIRAMAHDVVVMKDGSVVESGSVQRVLEDPQHPYTKTLVQAAQ